MRLTSPATLLDFDPFKTRTQADASHNLGDQAFLNDGRIFRYAKAGGSNISKGKLQLAPAPKTNHHNIAVAAAAASNTKTVTVTLGATAAVADEYDEGLLVVNDVTGEGQDYAISSHPAADSAATLVVTLFDPIATALTTSSEVSLVHNRWNGTVEGTAATRRGAGVPLVDVAAGDYAWLQSHGAKAVLNGSAVTLGARLMADASTAGAVTDQTDVSAPQAEVQVAEASIMAGVSTEYRPVVLLID